MKASLTSLKSRALYAFLLLAMSMMVASCTARKPSCSAYQTLDLDGAAVEQVTE